MQVGFKQGPETMREQIGERPRNAERDERAGEPSQEMLSRGGQVAGASEPESPE